MALSKDQKDTLRQVIEDSLFQIDNDLVDLKESAKPVQPDNAIGRLSRMEAIGQKSVKDAAIARAQGRQKKLKEALKRIDNDDFGICLECDEPIDWARLKSLPESVVCVECLEEAQN